MGEMKNEIIWEWCQYRVLRRADIGPDAALLIETRTHDALGGESWRETPDGEAGMVIERLAVELHDRVKKAEAGRERFREVVEAKLPEYVPSSNHDAAASLSRPHTHAYSRIDRELMPNEHEDPRVAEERRLVGLESHLASLRAELTALGKRVEDVERRAYASPTNDALTVELGHNINAPPGQIITTGERLDSLERRVSDNTDALALWQGAANRSTAKVDALHARIAKLEEREQEALERRVAALVVDPPHMRLRRPLSASSDAPVAEPLDLATLRVPGQATGVSETAVSFRPAGHALDIVTEVRVLPGYGSEERHEWVTVGPSEARLLARALTQWADEKEAKPGPSPRAYEPDSEDGS